MQWIWGIGVGALVALRIGKMIGTAIVIGETISEGNRVVKDVTSTDPFLHPSSWLLRAMKEMNSNNPRGWGETSPPLYFY